MRINFKPQNVLGCRRSRYSASISQTWESMERNMIGRKSARTNLCMPLSRLINSGTITNDSVGPLSRALFREYNAYLHSSMNRNKALPKDSWRLSICQYINHTRNALCLPSASLDATIDIRHKRIIQPIILLKAHYSAELSPTVFILFSVTFRREYWIC